jgi:hypothetical protein
MSWECSASGLRPRWAWGPGELRARVALGPVEATLIRARVTRSSAKPREVRMVPGLVIAQKKNHENFRKNSQTCSKEKYIDQNSYFMMDN